MNQSIHTVDLPATAAGDILFSAIASSFRLHQHTSQKGTIGKSVTVLVGGLGYLYNTPELFWQL